MKKDSLLFNTAAPASILMHVIFYNWGKHAMYFIYMDLLCKCIIWFQKLNLVTKHKNEYTDVINSQPLSYKATNIQFIYTWFCHSIPTNEQQHFGKCFHPNRNSQQTNIKYFQFKIRHNWSYLTIFHQNVLARCQFISETIWYITQLIYLSWEMLCTLDHRCFLDSTVGQCNTISSLLHLRLRAATTQPPEGSTKLLRHGVVDDGIDGTVKVHTDSTEKQEPGVQVSLLHERVDHHQSAVGHPQQSKQNDHYCQHLNHLP